MNIIIYKKSKKYNNIETTSFQVNENDNTIEIIWLNEKNQYQLEIFKKDEINFILE